MRAELIGHFKACMPEIYLHIDARMADYPYAALAHRYNPATGEYHMGNNLMTLEYDKPWTRCGPFLVSRTVPYVSRTILEDKCAHLYTNSCTTE